MKYIIDGYNIIGASDCIQLTDKHKEDQLVEWLKQRQTRGVHVVIVFDGQVNALDFPTKERLPGITKITTGRSQSADQYIKDVFLTKKDTSGMVIVTSDNDILYYAKKVKVSTMTSTQFLDHISRRGVQTFEKKTPPVTDADVDYWLGEFDND